MQESTSHVFESGERYDSRSGSPCVVRTTLPLATISRAPHLGARFRHRHELLRSAKIGCHSQKSRRSIVRISQILFHNSHGDRSSRGDRIGLQATSTEHCEKSHGRVWSELFYGFVIGIMGFGHLLAVTIKTVLGTLPGSVNPWFAFPFGFALAIPAWWLVMSVGGLMRNEKPARLKAMALNVWLGIVLLVPAWPLAVPAALNVLAFTWKRATST